MNEESVLTAPPRDSRTRSAPRGIARFATVGGTGAVLNTAVLYALYEWLRVPIVAASVVAIELAVISNYLLNDRWTFNAASRSLSRFARFNVASLGGVAVNVLAVAFLTRFGVHLVAANLIGIAAGFIANFALSSNWVWTTA